MQIKNVEISTHAEVALIEVEILLRRRKAN